LGPENLFGLLGPFKHSLGQKASRGNLGREKLPQLLGPGLAQKKIPQKPWETFTFKFWGISRKKLVSRGKAPPFRGASRGIWPKVWANPPKKVGGGNFYRG